MPILGEVDVYAEVFRRLIDDSQSNLVLVAGSE